MAPRLSGQNSKFVKFLLSLYSQKTLRYKENTTKINIEVCPESLEAMLGYCYIERGLLSLKLTLSIDSYSGFICYGGSLLKLSVFTQ